MFQYNTCIDLCMSLIAYFYPMVIRILTILQTSF